MEGRGDHGCFVFHSAGSLLSCPQRGPSAFSINSHVCTPHLFVLTDDFCNKTQTFWYFADSWVMTFRFAFWGLWLFPVENVARRDYSSYFLVGLRDEVKNRVNLADVLVCTIKSRPPVCSGTHPIRKQHLRNDNSLWEMTVGIKVYQPRKCHLHTRLYCSVLSSQLLFQYEKKCERDFFGWETFGWDYRVQTLEKIGNRKKLRQNHLTRSRRHA